MCSVEWILERMIKNKKNKKNKKKIRERKLFRKFLVERGREENDGGAQVIFSRTHQKVLFPK